MSDLARNIFSAEEIQKADNLIGDWEIGNGGSRVKFSISTAKINKEFWIFKLAVDRYIKNECQIFNEIENILQIIKGLFQERSKKKISLDIPTTISVGKKTFRLQRKLVIQYNPNEQKVLFILKSGYSIEEGQRGKIREILFDVTDRPGLLDAQGKIFFRKISKFPFVEEGEILLIVDDPIKGKSGISFKGDILGFKKVPEYPIEIQGACRKEVITSRKKRIGYRVIAEVAGIVYFEKKNEGKKLSLLEVKDKIAIEGDVGYGIGDLEGGNGLDRFPVKIIITGNLLPGFLIRNSKDVIIKGVQAAEIDSLGKVTAREVYPRSHIKALRNLEVGFSRESVLQTSGMLTLLAFEKSEVANMSITSSKVTANKISLKKRHRLSPQLIGSKFFVRNKVEAQDVVLAHGNEVRLGEKLFQERDKISLKIASVENELKELKKEKSKIGNEIFAILIEIGRGLLAENDERGKDFSKLRDNFQDICNNIQQYQNGRNNKKIMLILAKLKASKEKAEKLELIGKEVLKLEGNFASLNREISGLKFELNGRMKKSSRLKIILKNEVHIFETGERESPVEIKVSYDLIEEEFVLVRSIPGGEYRKDLIEGSE